MISIKVDARSEDFGDYVEGFTFNLRDNRTQSGASLSFNLSVLRELLTGDLLKPFQLTEVFNYKAMVHISCYHAGAEFLNHSLYVETIQYTYNNGEEHAVVELAFFSTEVSGAPDISRQHDLAPADLLAKAVKSTGYRLDMQVVEPLPTNKRRYKQNGSDLAMLYDLFDRYQLKAQVDSVAKVISLFDYQAKQQARLSSSFAFEPQSFQYTYGRPLVYRQVSIEYKDCVAVKQPVVQESVTHGAGDNTIKTYTVLNEQIKEGRTYQYKGAPQSFDRVRDLAADQLAMLKSNPRPASFSVSLHTIDGPIPVIGGLQFWQVVTPQINAIISLTELTIHYDAHNGYHFDGSGDVLNDGKNDTKDAPNRQ